MLQTITRMTLLRVILTTIFLLVSKQLNNISSFGQPLHDEHTEASLLQFLDWNGVPGHVYIGLTSKSSTLEKHPLVNGTCFLYDLLNNPRCQFYSDCCAVSPSRPREQLPFGTFSCHDGYYVVDKCPSSTRDWKLREKCEATAGMSGIALGRWPVRGVLNKLTYKNIFCALCNGISTSLNHKKPAEQPWYKYHIDFGYIDSVTRYIDETVDVIEWLPVELRCDRDKIEYYVQNKPTHSALMDLVYGFCTVSYIPPLLPDRCFEAIRDCPRSVNEEVRLLCEKGPANYITIDKQTFRNQFCATCHKAHVSMVEARPAQPKELTQDPIKLSWANNRLMSWERTSEEHTNQELLAVLKPTVTKNKQLLYLNSSMGNNFNSNIDIVCQLFAFAELDFCRKDYATVPKVVSNDTLDTPIWDLASLGCYSPNPKVCDLFAVPSTADTCGYVGCKTGQVIDLETLSCMEITDFTLSNPLHDEDLSWHSAPICSYTSQCKAVKLGLMSEHELNCHCDHFCIYFDDCCEDSPYQEDKSMHALPQGTFSCVSSSSHMYREDWESRNRTLYGIMEVNKCPPGYSNQSVAEKCTFNSWWHAEYKFSLVSIPVSDSKTGLRYRNFYCALCHGVTDIVYWTMEIGCIEVANDECRFPVDSTRPQRPSRPFSNQVDGFAAMYLDNPAAENLLSRNCRVREFKPPKASQKYRECREDFTKYVSTCPNYTDDWEISRKCANEPASFVYEGPPLSTYIDRIGIAGCTHSSTYQYMEGHTEYIASFGSHRFNIQKYNVGKKFKNSYCANCHGVAWLGCKVGRTVTILGNETKESSALYEQYISGIKKFMFVFVVDYNNRSCVRNSDSYVLYPNVDTGRDTCMNITQQLRQCDSGSQYDIGPAICTPVPNQNKASLSFPTNESQDLFEYQYSKYALENCSPEITRFEYPSATELEQYCSRCDVNVTTPVETNFTFDLPAEECIPVFSLAYKSPPSQYANLYCAASAQILFRCTPDAIISEEDGTCQYEYWYREIGVLTERLFVLRSDILLQNSISVVYKPTGFEFHIEELKGSGGYDLLFATFTESSEGYCAKFSNLTDGSKGYLVCPDHSLKDPELNVTHSDFYLQGNEIGVCAEFKYPGFVIEIQNYVLSALSIVCVIVYLVYYAVKGKKTLTSYFVVSSLCTLVAALLCYCFINMAAPRSVSCMAIALLTQYLMLCIHSWTNALAVWVFRGITKVVIVADNSGRLYFYYALYAWLAPLVFVVVATVLHFAKVPLFYPVFSPYICFLNSGWIRLILFTGPIFLLIVVDLILGIAASIKVSTSGQRLATQDKRRTTRNIVTILKLKIIFGFHWFLMFFTWIEGDTQRILWKILGILISLQGVLVIVSQLINVDKMVKTAKKIGLYKSKVGTSSNIARETSSTKL